MTRDEALKRLAELAAPRQISPEFIARLERHGELSPEVWDNVVRLVEKAIEVAEPSDDTATPDRPWSDWHDAHMAR